jgi:hypothetical protein
MVTVFGFPQGSTQQILKQFQKYGQIVRYLMGEGNWLHIEYLTRLEAQNALAKNGIKIDKNLMIGVIPYTEQVCFFEFCSQFQRSTQPVQIEPPKQIFVKTQRSLFKSASE